MPSFESLGIVKFLKEARVELSKVRWPTQKETVKLTVIVVGVSLLVGAYIGAWDFIFTKLLALVLKK